MFDKLAHLLTPKRRCQFCDKPLPDHRSWFCDDACRDQWEYRQVR